MYLCYQDRLYLSEIYFNGSSPKQIAKMLNVSLSTVYRELNKGYTGRLNKNGVPEYSAIKAQQTYVDNLKHRGRKRGTKNA